MRLMKIKYPHETKLKDRLHSCLDMCRIPHVVFDDGNCFTIFIDKGKCTWNQVMTEVNRVHAVKFRYVNAMYIRSGENGEFELVEDCGTVYIGRNFI